jgi:hypothetical protein
VRVGFETHASLAMRRESSMMDAAYRNALAEAIVTSITSIPTTQPAFRNDFILIISEEERHETSSP